MRLISCGTTSLICAFLMAGIAYAQQSGRGHGHDGELPPHHQHAHIQPLPLADSVRRIERSGNGRIRVLSAERVQFDGRDVNRIKVMDQRGRVRIYTDDGTTQQVSYSALDQDDE